MYSQLIKSRLGIENFKYEQWQAIKAVLFDKRDCFIQTSKSFPEDIVYQFATVVTGKTTVVFVDSKKEINRQTQELTKKRIRFYVLNQNIRQNNQEQLRSSDLVFYNIGDHCEYDNVNTVQSLLDMLFTMRESIGLFVIDECHSLSQQCHKMRK